MSQDRTVVKTHRRGFAPPAWRLVQAVTTDVGDWLELNDAESLPEIVQIDETTVAWSSLWPGRPGDLLRLEVETQGSGSDLRWSLECPADDLPDDLELDRIRYRINQLLNGQLRDHLDTRG